MRDYIFKTRQIWFVTMLLSCLMVSAYDFTVDGIYYNVINLAKLECEVTKGDERYINLDIPSTVNFNNRTFKVKRIGDSACEMCYDLKYVKIPNSVISIGDKAFYSCSKALTTITIPDSVVSIGERAFEHCEALEDVTIGNAVTDIGTRAFSDCVSLHEVKMGSSVKNIGDQAFSYCEKLRSIELPNTVETLGMYAFLNCRSLSKVKLSNNLKVLEYGTFCGCRELEDIYIPGSVDRIVAYNLYDDNSLVFSDLRILRLGYSDKELVWGEYSRKKGFVEGANDLKEQYFADGDRWTLGLRVVVFNRPLKIPMKLPKLVKVYFGENIKTVQISDLQKCDQLQTIVCDGTEPPILPECSNKQYLNVVVKVPQEALEKYQQAPVWKNFMNLEGYDPSERDNL